LFDAPASDHAIPLPRLSTAVQAPPVAARVKTAFKILARDPRVLPLDTIEATVSI
jgi:hypothetical protein